MVVGGLHIPSEGVGGVQTLWEGLVAVGHAWSCACNPR